MQTILITGAKGFIGRNLIQTLKTQTNYSIIPFDADNTEDDLIDGINKSDLIIHLAGVNRAQSTDDFVKVNVNLTHKLLTTLKMLNKNIPILATSSIQATLDNPYGKSKKKMEDLILSWTMETKNKAFIYRLPNVFGKWCKPNYNSVIATFCYNIAHDLPLNIHDPEKLLALAYIDDVIHAFCNTLAHLDDLSTGFYSVSPIYSVSLKEVADKLTSLVSFKNELLSPNLNNDFDKALYATYLSYVDPDKLSNELIMHTNDRGWLSEFIKSREVGQIFISKTLPGITRGNHWHQTKVEKFLVICGLAHIRLRHIQSEKVIDYIVSDKKLQAIDIPPGYTHSIENIGSNDLITLFWASEVFDPNSSDTYYEEVLL